MPRSIAQPDCLEELLRRVSGLTPDTPRRWGTMTPGEMLCHLSDTANSVLSGSRTGSSVSRPVRRWVALCSGIPWPHGVRTPAAVDPRLRGTRPAQFDQDRARAVEGLKRLASSPDEAFSSSHKLFGRMTRVDWQRWAFRHSNHHLKQFGL